MQTPSSRKTEKPSRLPRDLWIYLALFLMTFLVYAQVRHFDFVNFDDPEYVSGNLHVRRGLTLDGLRWALTSVEAANWFPVTRLSHMLDYQIFGLESGWHHLTSVLFHSLAALLLFAFLRRSSGACRPGACRPGARWPAAFVAVLFSLHPLHVESVAWIAERKDVLSAFFWFLTLWAYVRYTERPAWGRYALVVLTFCLGLMSKPMIVTLPFVLILLDVWPLRRPVITVLREKIPFFALSAMASAATYFVQRGSGAVEGLSAFPFPLRVENALVSYVVYIGKMFWPTRLAVFYPYPASLPWWEAVVACLVLAGISALVLRWFPAYPYLAAGWLWYLVTLVPVIGLIQVGAQARADRYMYVPMVGLSIILAWGAADVLLRWPRARPAVAVLAVAVCFLCVPVTLAQVEHWKSSLSLFQHALDVTDGNYVARHNLGVALSEIPGRLPEAIAQYEAALSLQPDSAKVHTDLGSALAKVPGRLPEAIDQYRAALRITPDSAITHNDLGNALSRIPGRVPEAISEYQAALRSTPDYPEALNNLGSALAKIGRVPEALTQFEAAIQLEPDYAEAHTNLGGALSAIPGRLTEAIAEYQTALRLTPDAAEAHNNLGAALAEAGRVPEAIAEYEAALSLKPNYADAHINLGNALSEVASRVPEAISEYEAALRIEPNSAEAHYNLGAALSKTNNQLPDAIAHFEAALRIRPGYAEAHNNLGVVLTRIRGRTGEAISHFEAALRIKPDYPDAHYNLGIALAEMPGRLPEAIAQFEASLRLRPDPELQKLVDRLRAGQR